MNVKELVESVKVWEYPTPLSFQSRPMSLVEKSEFDRVVEELTKWNKVEDCLPEINQTIIAKRQSGRIGICEFKGGLFIDSLIGLSVNVTEWKHIF